MCGIVGYVGKREAYEILIKGLDRLEYRGYDSAGVALFGKDTIFVFKKNGKVAELKKFIKNNRPSSTLGIAHTRWATHGAPSDKNAHPQLSNSGDIAIVHNGIIENYLSIKEILIKKGYQFKSDTDTEVLVNLIEDIKKNTKTSLDEAVRLALLEVTGSYAILVLSKDEPNTIIIAKVGSPIVIGIGNEKDGEFFIASDATPVIEYTDKVIYLEDKEMAIIKNKKLLIKGLDNEVKNPCVKKIEMKIEELEKNGFPHFMLKEIFEQPRSITDSINGRIKDNGTIKLVEIGKYKEKILNAKRIIILACGTSWHAGLEAKYFFEEYAKIPVSVEYASEFRYRNPVIYKNDLIIAISQSGETADTLAAVKLAKDNGAIILSICNVIGSSISRISHVGLYTHAGPEIGVASTKAFTTQVAVLMLVSLFIASEKKLLSKTNLRNILTELKNISKKVEQTLLTNNSVKKIANKLKNYENFIYLGRGYGYPLALEGALKLKEISYIHAEGFASGEMKHGSIALVDKNLPVLFITNKGSSYEKIISNMMEVKARNGIIVAIITKGDVYAKKIADYSIEIPQISDTMLPFIVSIPLQLLAYHIALLRGCEIDKPRNLAKSVTVE